MPRRRRLALVAPLVGVSLLVLAGILLWTRWSRPARIEAWLTDAELAYSTEEFGQAQELVDRVLMADPMSRGGLLLAAQLAERKQRWDDAITFYGRLPMVADVELLRAHCQAADLWLSHHHRVREAETLLRKVLEVDPDFSMAHHGLAYLCHQTGRPWSAMRHLAAMIRSRNFSAEQLINFNLAGATTITLDHAKFLAADPTDPWARLGLARVSIAAGDLDAAIRWTREAVRLVPQETEPFALLGQLFADREMWSDLVDWRNQLPQTALAHPEVWFSQARWAAAAGQRPAAIRCTLEALRRYPNHQAANYFVGQLLKQDGDSSAEFYLARANRTQQIVNTVRAMVAVVLQRPEMVVQAIDQFEAAGRVWEAWAWSVLLRGEHPEIPGLDERKDQLATACRAEVDEWLCLVGPAHAGPLSPDRFPLPEWPTTPTAPSGAAGPAATIDSPFRLEDRAREIGLDFRYDNGAVEASRGLMMYEFTGGGIAAFDYDGDLWPDLFLTQGGPWPTRGKARAQREGTDRLFRNQFGTRVQDVTESARLVDSGFSQGVTAGDFDGDGHVDLFVANIGANQLFQNLGDGTFREVSREAGIARTSAWSTSVASADLNGDGLPDWYVVNYLGGPDVFQRICEGPDRQRAICPPQVFPAADDELYINNGDGTFSETSADSGILQPDGKGLGLVVGQLDDDRRLDLFVANDATPNFFFLNATPDGAGIPKLSESGLARGLAFDSGGDTQACMGVAADDADGNGLIDLFVTNFWLEPNTLYLQTSSGLFADEVRRSGLFEPSLRMLGFGTQFFDGDLDGRPELFVANGNVGKDTSGKIPYEMPPQVFLNRGEGRFQEAAPASLGDYFAGKWLGRGVARLDFNRDGRDDLAITHLDRPAALLFTAPGAAALPERTPRSIQLQFAGTLSERDAIGTRVAVSPAAPPSSDRVTSTPPGTAASPTGSSWTKQLTAGDGYQARNEAILTFGCDGNAPSKIVVTWPSGRTAEIDIRGRTELRWKLVEGRDEPAPLSDVD